jgi:hypothetical protein
MPATSPLCSSCDHIRYRSHFTMRTVGTRVTLLTPVTTTRFLTGAIPLYEDAADVAEGDAVQRRTSAKGTCKVKIRCVIVVWSRCQ